MKHIIFSTLSILLVITINLQGQTKGSGYQVIDKITIGGEGGWDYLLADTLRNRLFVSHGTKAEVIDLAKKIKIGEIPNTNGIHGLALVPDFERGFTSNGRDSSVTIFDFTSLKVIGTVKLNERNPDAIIYDPFSKRIFTFNGGSKNATAIDAKTGTVVGTVDLGDKPENAVPDGKGTMYVNLETTSMLAAFNTQTLKVINKWPIAPGEEASGLAFDREHRRLFAGCSNKLLVVFDPDAGKVVTSLPIGDGVDGVAFDPETHLIFSSNGEGTLTVIREETPDTYTVLENVPTERGARTVTLDGRTHRVYLPTAKFGPAPAPTADRPRPRPSIIPDSFMVLVVGK